MSLSDIDKTISNMLPDIGIDLERVFNGDSGELKDQKIGFILMALAFNTENARCFYNSNISRDQVIALMKTQVVALEAMTVNNHDVES